MIVDHLDNAERHFQLHPLFAEAFRAIRSTPQWPSGRATLGQNGLFTFSHDGLCDGGTKLEVHRTHLDIHCTLEGVDHFAWRALADCSLPTAPFNTELDCGMFHDTASTITPLTKGMFAIVWPDDVHAPLHLPGTVRKVVVKVPIHRT